MSVYYINSELYHHGVKGMRWGVRRTPEQLGRKRAQKGGVDERYINKALKQAYALNRKTNKSAHQSKRQMRIEGELETYINTNRNPAKDAALSKAIAREQNRKPSAIQAKLNDPEFKRKALKGAKVAVGIAAIYATHKVINNPEVLNKGKDLLLKSLDKTGPLKASIVNSAEFKLLSKAKEPAKAALDFFGSDKFAKAVTTAGVIATTASSLRGKVKDLRENKVNGDALDKALTYTKKVSSIGEDVNTLAKATKGETTSSSSSNSSTSSNSSSTDSSGKPKTEFTKKGGSEKIYANKHLSSNDLRTLKEYRQKHSTPSYTMSIEEALDELGWLDKDR